jgi:hypothetical protein
MAKFKYSDTKYLKLLIDDIKSKKPIKIGIKGENEIIIKYDYVIKKLAKNHNLIKDTIFTGINGKQYKFTHLFKGTYSGFLFNKTSLQEVGVIIAIDSLLQNGEVLNLETYQPSKKIKINTDIDNVLSFLKENKSWLKSVNETALGIVNKIGSEHKLNDYTIHHNDILFKSIRNIGKKLSGLSSADKWNPSDFYFIEKLDIDEI